MPLSPDRSGSGCCRFTLPGMRTDIVWGEQDSEDSAWVIVRLFCTDSGSQVGLQSVGSLATRFLSLDLQGDEAWRGSGGTAQLVASPSLWSSLLCTIPSLSSSIDFGGLAILFNALPQSSGSLANIAVPCRDAAVERLRVISATGCLVQGVAQLGAPLRSAVRSLGVLLPAGHPHLHLAFALRPGAQRVTEVTDNMLVTHAAASVEFAVLPAWWFSDDMYYFAALVLDAMRVHENCLLYLSRSEQYETSKVVVRLRPIHAIMYRLLGVEGQEATKRSVADPSEIHVVGLHGRRILLGKNLRIYDRDGRVVFSAEWFRGKDKTTQLRGLFPSATGSLAGWAEVSKKKLSMILPGFAPAVRCDAGALPLLEAVSAGAHYREQQTCPVCGSTATRACTGCFATRYCGAECQFRHWKEHRMSCSQLSTAGR